MASQKRKSEENVPYHVEKLTWSDDICVIHFTGSNCESF